jgi:pimeloyl-ACP methyl ester carboxylesterase
MLPLSQGGTHIRWSGPVRGPVAVLIHGLTSPLQVWDQIAAGVAALGYRVLCYDLYGRGLSDAPRGQQDLPFFTRQLGDLLTSQGLSENVTLIGYSMGGAIATAYAAANPQQVRQVVLIAPAGIVPGRMDGPTSFAVNTPVIGDWLFHMVAPRRARARLSDTAPPGAEALWAAKGRNNQRQGHHPAVLSSLRHALRTTLESEHRALGRADVPVYALWAEQDTDIPVRGLGQLAAWNRYARQEVIPGATHALPYTYAAEVLDRLRTMLRED